MRVYYKNNITERELSELYRRKYINNTKIVADTNKIVNEVKKKGLKAALRYSRVFDDFNNQKIKINEEEINNAEDLLTSAQKKAIDNAYTNIYKFHLLQGYSSYSVDIDTGIECFRETRAIENVGLYVPGGTAVLPSTLLMLGIPAKIAGCKRIVVITPVKDNKSINPAVLYVAFKLGITEIYTIGGPQGIALIAYGTDEIKKVDKIFGPGNQYVTIAKSIVSQDAEGAAMDMPAGPSEVLVIADKYANPEFVVADLLSQAEHGQDSQVVLITNSKELAEDVIALIEEKKNKLKRKDYIEASLKNSFMVITETISDSIEFSNNYSPEHLILNVKNSKKYISQISNAGSVFIGSFSSESAGDYASGTNHSLPTYGYAKSYSGLKVEDFQKTITFQKISKNGIKKLAPVIFELSAIEGLDAHADAVKVRL